MRRRGVIDIKAFNENPRYHRRRIYALHINFNKEDVMADLRYKVGQVRNSSPIK